MEDKLLLEKYFPKTWDDIMLPDNIKQLLTKMCEKPGYRLLLHSSPGTGKCLGLNTPVLMFDGSIKNVQDVVVGDKLMGLDSTPRNVLSTCIGREEMFEIKPNKGEPWTCNKSHIHTLIESGVWKDYKNGKLPDVFDFKELNTLQVKNLPINHRKKLFQVPLNFPKKETLIDPYWLGYWLGDGVSSEPYICVGNNDLETIYPTMNNYAKSLNMWITETNSKNSVTILKFVCNQRENIISNNHLKKLMKEYDLIGNKHIPKEYLLNDRDTRLKLFAGYIDSDGGGEITDGTYDFCTKFKQLNDDLIWLCHSLGYHVNSGIKFIEKIKVNGEYRIINKEYYRIQVSGDFSDLPVIYERKKFTRKINKNPLVNGFKIKSIGEGDYYGFEIDGDKRFLLGDFTVTHNSTTARLMISDSKKYETMYLSGSNDFKIETLRQKVMQFASGHSVTGKSKVIIIDEAENIRDNLQDAFKIILDQCKTVSFIFITNEIEKINIAVRSRCTCIEYDFSGPDLVQQQNNFIKFAVNICKAENIQFDPRGIKELYIKLFPDFRHLVVALQQLIDSNLSITYDNVKGMSESGKQNTELYAIIEDNTLNGKMLYESCSKLKGKERECLISLGEPFFEYLNDKQMSDTTLKVAVIVSKYSDMFVTSINKYVTFFSCIVELRTLFR